MPRRARWGAVAWVIAGLLGPWSAQAAVVGEPAPEFSLTDAEGRTRTLAEFKGRVVVLEWMNPECPFVRKHYGSGNMQRLQRTYTARDVQWLSMNSSAPGRQGHLTPDDAKRVTQEWQAAPTALLLDPAGTVGRRYGAKTTPHLFIIDPNGRLLYEGAIDSIPSSDPADVTRATNYVEAALEEALAGKPVSTPSTKPYGCSVKYAD